MPLSKAAPRDHIHTRDIVCRGYRRKDGLWDIEASLTDIKTYCFDNDHRDGIAAGEPIHHMLMRLTLDDEMVVQSAEASTEAAPYGICGNVTEAFSQLAGLKIGPGWRKAVHRIMGGVCGCTHLRDLLMGPAAVTAYQTIIPIRRRDGTGDPTARPGTLNTCHAYAEDGAIVRQHWPNFYTGD